MDTTFLSCFLVKTSLETTFLLFCGFRSHSFIPPLFFSSGVTFFLIFHVFFSFFFLIFFCCNIRRWNGIIPITYYNTRTFSCYFCWPSNSKGPQKCSLVCVYLSHLIVPIFIFVFSNGSVNQPNQLKTYQRNPRLLGLETVFLPL